MRLVTACLALFALVLPELARASPCQAFVRAVPGARIAALGTVAADPGTVTIRYIAHSSFRITTPQGVEAITDYFGALGPGGPPDIATMNHAHETHWTPVPDERIRHVLKGWKEGGGKAIHHLKVKDLVVRNVTTDIRGWGAPEKDGNSIFVFEVAGLCIGHLGHLHHLLSDPQYAELGTIDVLMAPVDGTWTLSTRDIATVVRRLKSRVVLPMHWFGAGSLSRFVTELDKSYPVRWHEGPLELSTTTMPKTPEVVILQRGRQRGID